MIFKKLKNRKGFSLVEVVIAMAVVSIVTITAIAIIYPATDKTKEANAKSDAIYFVADAIECFKVKDVKTPEGTFDFSGVLGTLMFRDGVTPTSALSGYDYGFNINGSKYYVYIDIILAGSVGDEGETILYDTLRITAKDSEGHDLVEELTFEKAPR